MNQSIESLHKILQLEKAKGYNNTAVIGGLDRYLQGWRSSVGDATTSPFSIQSDFSYAALTQQQRETWVTTTLLKLTGKTSTSSIQINTQAITQVIPPVEHTLDSPITIIKGVNQTVAKGFSRMGLITIRDMLYFFPRRHLDYSQRRTVSELEAGTEQTLVATVFEAQQVNLGTRRSTEAYIGDNTGTIRAVWFNQPYLARTLRPHSKIVVSGKVGVFKGKNVFESPEWELMEFDDLVHTGRLVPVYPLTQGLTSRVVRRILKQVIDGWAHQMSDYLPNEIQTRCGLIPLASALEQAHFPKTLYAKDQARRRLAFDEFFILQLGVISKKHNWQELQQGNALDAVDETIQRFVSSLPFSLTKAQERVLKEIGTDLKQPKPMSRLLQGDVGSGKTVIAIASLLTAVANGLQGALMAPTEILAEQHFNSILTLFERIGHLEQRQSNLCTYSYLLPSKRSLTVALLTGSVSPKEKQATHQSIREGSIDLVIGTQALIQKGVHFANLGVAVVDEQHRFGVMQRSALSQKGTQPHILVMSATPIPRTLALTLYGDLNLSIIDQLPPGRKAIRTRCVSPEQREKAYSFLRSKIEEERQAFIICPLVEESDKIEAKAAIQEYQRLSEMAFPDLRLGLLHGRMTNSEKEKIMRSFRARELDILVTTSVVEVGIDVPNATIMMVEGADRFGLSQLHQFRGRVGRGEHQSFCLLLSESTSTEAQERLGVLERTQDGFLLAEEDLRLRGPGDFFGTRQSGLSNLRMAKLSDVSILELAREEAIRMFGQDPELKKPEHVLLAKERNHIWEQRIASAEGKSKRTHAASQADSS
ncbi:MAG: ATP-dependent DNA helicase RecG [Chloroflexota bacterium]|nr:ATP-dependent DNA helicase RecG [Chloroflexota bacterium]